MWVFSLLFTEKAPHTPHPTPVRTSAWDFGRSASSVEPRELSRTLGRTLSSRPKPERSRRVNNKLAAVPRQIKVSDKPKGKLVIECDEMLTLREAEGWSFVFSKTIKVYIWLAIDRNTREIIGCYLGDRSRQSAKKLWASLPGVYRQCAVAYTDFWESYKTVIPSKRHRAVGKETGQTNPIERLNRACWIMVKPF